MRTIAAFVLMCFVLGVRAVEGNAKTHTILILTYNVHHFEGRDGKVDPDRFVEILRGCKADIIGLNEVYHPFFWHGGFWMPLWTLRKGLGYRVVFAPNLHVFKMHVSGFYGNALLTRFRVVRWTKYPLPRNPSGGRKYIEPRGLLEVELDIDGYPITIFLTHLHSGEPKELREKQVEVIIEKMRKCNTPHILMGDFNDLSPLDPEAPPARSNAIARILKEGYVDAFRYLNGHELGGTFPSHRPIKRVDFIFLSPDLVPYLRSAGVLRTPLTAIASDHYPVWAELEIR
jgi:endonuclease/exonuclease/phosphatase family metal-dependent hydrolase